MHKVKRPRAPPLRLCKHCGVLKPFSDFGQGREFRKCYLCAQDEGRGWHGYDRRVSKPWQSGTVITK